ncbi:hypothetical protein [Sphingobacterium yanglingense]|uniref:Uncharacterized protein n=1 Tax=Sphingobacterium yanglingense TaxID=1437280 RepID=A0A4R6WGE8_9SPHI|nr:hypothetical protein [Sphingobacterium yanglingense]TDQ79174.1 hypothetical protein CLV99_0606 [Sphingobacterium yanglingense]
MKKGKYLIIGILILVVVMAVGFFIFLGALSGMGNPTGGRGPDYPYFITTEPTSVKNIIVPKGTKLTYEEQFFKEGQQDRIMNEKELIYIELPEGQTIDWGGVPVYMFVKFFNPEMLGFSVYADFDKLSDDKKTKFSELWQSCQSDLGVLVENTNDWTFSTPNIVDITSCGVNYQRYFKEDRRQQQFLDSLYREFKEIKF